MEKDHSEHIPVLLNEVITVLDPKRESRYVDATLGFGGHSLAILKNKGRVLGIEWDPKVIKLTKERFLSVCPNAPWTLVNDNFTNIDKIVKRKKFYPVDGIIFDLGISFWHYKKAKRGFSFKDEILDMRINPKLRSSARELVNSYSQKELYELFSKIAQEKLAGPIAQALVNARRLGKIESAQVLSNIVADVYKKNKIGSQLNPATKIFLSLRTAVNQELENLKIGLDKAFEVLGKKGKLLVITFNSNEDRLVKMFLKEKKNRKETEKIGIFFPTNEETKFNPLSRSAKLRWLIKN